MCEQRGGFREQDTGNREPGDALRIVMLPRVSALYRCSCCQKIEEYETLVAGYQIAHPNPPEVGFLVCPRCKVIRVFRRLPCSMIIGG